MLAIFSGILSDILADLLNFLEFTEEEYQFVLDKMTKDKRTPEDIFRAGLV